MKQYQAQQGVVCLLHTCTCIVDQLSLINHFASVQTAYKRAKVHAA